MPLEILSKRVDDPIGDSAAMRHFVYNMLIILVYWVRRKVLI